MFQTLMDSYQEEDCYHGLEYSYVPVAIMDEIENARDKWYEEEMWGL